MSARSDSPDAVVPGALWAISNLLLLPGGICAVLSTGHRGPSPLAWAGISLLTLSALVLLTMFLVTLHRTPAYAWNANFSGFSRPLRWLLTAGTWIGMVPFLFALLAQLFDGTLSIAAPSTNARFAMAAHAVIGAVLSFFAILRAPPWIGGALFSLWGAVLLGTILRGSYGIMRKMTAKTRG